MNRDAPPERPAESVSRHAATLPAAADESRDFKARIAAAVKIGTTILQRVRRIAAIQCGRAVHRAALTLRQLRERRAAADGPTMTGRAHTAMQVVRAGIRRRPKLAGVCLLGLIAGGIAYSTMRGPAEKSGGSQYEDPLVLDDVKVFPADPAPAKSSPPDRNSRSTTPSERPKFGATPSVGSAGHPSRDGRSGPLFPSTSTGAAQHSQPIHPAVQRRPKRAVWFTGTVEDPDRDIAQVRAISHGEFPPRFSNRRNSPRPPRYPVRR